MLIEGIPMENVRKKFRSRPDLIQQGVVRYSMYIQLGQWNDKFKDLLPKIQDTFKQVRANTSKDKFIYPHPDNVFRAFYECPPHQTKIVILGMDPYHTPGMATGLAFDSPKMTPSLRAILKELDRSTGIKIGSIDHWPSQGILLLNTALTVEEGKPGSHIPIWKETMKDILQIINELPEPIIWVLMGEQAKAWATHINPHHYIVTSPHPSPLSRRFPGCGVFDDLFKIAKQMNLKINLDKPEC